ncbi:unnamed protein product [Amoebophrya sp. A120]|nr:unnamed protein product [Amoebophrya sp. A120]|eukprot:GSA120T00002276001.1
MARSHGREVESCQLNTVEPLSQGNCKVSSFLRVRSDFAGGNGAGRAKYCSATAVLDVYVAAPRTGWPRAGRKYVRTCAAHRGSGCLLDLTQGAGHGTEDDDDTPGGTDSKANVVGASACARNRNGESECSCEVLICTSEAVARGGKEQKNALRDVEGFAFHRTKLRQGSEDGTKKHLTSPSRELREHDDVTVVVSKADWRRDFSIGRIRELLPEEHCLPRFPGGWFYLRIEQPVDSVVDTDKDGNRDAPGPGAGSSDENASGLHGQFGRHGNKSTKVKNIVVHNMRQRMKTKNESSASWKRGAPDESDVEGGENAGGASYTPWYRYRIESGGHIKDMDSIATHQKLDRTNGNTNGVLWSSWKRWPATLVTVEKERQLFAGPERFKYRLALKDEMSAYSAIEVAHSVPYAPSEASEFMEQCRRNLLCQHPTRLSTSARPRLERERHVVQEDHAPAVREPGQLKTRRPFFLSRSDAVLGMSCDGERIPLYVFSCESNREQVSALLRRMENKQTQHQSAADDDTASTCSTAPSTVASPMDVEFEVEQPPQIAHFANFGPPAEDENLVPTVVRELPLVTLQSSNSIVVTPLAKKPLKAVFCSARCHPTESAASFAFEGFVSALCEKWSAEDWIFVLVPMLNPDGVTRGHFRANAVGHDLNRCYSYQSDSHRLGGASPAAAMAKQGGRGTQKPTRRLKKNPAAVGDPETSSAVVAADFDAVPALVERVWPVLQSFTDFCLYVDFHSFEHGAAASSAQDLSGTERGAGSSDLQELHPFAPQRLSKSFMYHQGTDDNEDMCIADIDSASGPDKTSTVTNTSVAMQECIQCRFKIKEAKEKNGGSGRAVAARFARHSYTLESYAGESPELWHQDGRALLQAVLEHLDTSNDTKLLQ